MYRLRLAQTHFFRSVLKPVKLCALPSLFLLAIGFQSFADSEWKKVKESKGVQVFEKKVKKDIAFRGVATLEGTSDQFLEVLQNTKRWEFWVENLKSGKLIEKKSDSVKVYRQVIGTPFPMKDREAVYESEIKRLNPSTTVVEMRSVNHPAVKRSKDNVRIEITYTRYRIEDTGNGKIRVTFENLSQAGGKVPKFLSNWASRSYPITLLNGIQREIYLLKETKSPFLDGKRDFEPKKIEL